MQRGPSRDDVLARLDGYVDDVVSGRRVVGKYERLAVARHVRDLETCAARGLRWNEARAVRAVWWIEAHLFFADDVWAGQPFVLQPWQVFVVAALFGWERNVDGDWVRRFRTAYLTMARKNAKSYTMAAIALCMLMTGGAAQGADGRWKPVPGAELYSAATTRDQAAIVWRAAAKVAKRSPAIRKQLDIPARITKSTRCNIGFHRESAFFAALAADSDTLDGLNPLLAVVDELHAHKDGTLWDVLQSGTGARKDPLQIAITTAGADRESVCGEVESDACKVLDGVYEDDSLFAFVCRLDDDDDPFNEATWVKANPNLGVSVYLDGLRIAANAASNNPGRMGEFLRKRCNIWTTGETAWVKPERWDAATLDAAGNVRTVDLDALRGRECYAGVDLGASNDTTSVCLAFPLDDGSIAVHVRTFVPADTIDDHERRGPRERELLKRWSAAGVIVATPGDMADYDVVWEWLLNAQERFDLREAAFDRWSASSLFGRCEQLGIEAVPFGQGYASMSPAVRFAENYVGRRMLVHGNDPVLRWFVSNLSMRTDPAGNIKPDKSKATRRIDGAVAMFMALGRASLNVGNAGGGLFVHVLGREDDANAEGATA